MQELQKNARAARTRAVDRDELKRQLDRARLEHANLLVEIDELRSSVSRQARTVQDQVSM